MNKSLIKKRHIEEANRLMESRMSKNILIEQVVPLMTVLANPAALAVNGTDNSNKIYLAQRNNNGQVIPGSKYSYEVRGKYGFVGFDISLRKVYREPKTGDLIAQAFPKNGIVQNLLKTLVPKKNRTEDNWLYVRVPNAKLNEALTMLKTNKGSEATLDAGGGIKVALKLIP